MPELPEVEVVRRGLATHLVGRTFVRISVLDARSLRRQVGGSDDFVSRLTGRRVVDIKRRGKYMWWVLDDDSTVVVHLGMSGQVLVNDGAPHHRHARIVGELDSGTSVVFADQRLFGGLFLDDSNPPSAISHIALDPLDPLFDDSALVQRMRNKDVSVKRCLLDQALISGIGNIYADEALWRARLHFEKPAARISRAKMIELMGHARDVMTEALDQGGTSFDALYVNVEGESGYFARELNAYGREGQPCDRCGTAIRRASFMNRSSFFCPRCQRKS